jgi:hypothetical protein
LGVAAERSGHGSTIDLTLLLRGSAKGGVPLCGSGYGHKRSQVGGLQPRACNRLRGHEGGHCDHDACRCAPDAFVPKRSV